MRPLAPPEDHGGIILLDRCTCKACTLQLYDDFVAELRERLRPPYSWRTAVKLMQTLFLLIVLPIFLFQVLLRVGLGQIWDVIVQNAIDISIKTYATISKLPLLPFKVMYMLPGWTWGQFKQLLSDIGEAIPLLLKIGMRLAGGYVAVNWIIPMAAMIFIVFPVELVVGPLTPPKTPEQEYEERRREAIHAVTATLNRRLNTQRVI